MNIFEAQGYESKEKYFRYLSEEYEIKTGFINMLARDLTDNECFGSLVVTLEDISDKYTSMTRITFNYLNVITARGGGLRLLEFRNKGLPSLLDNSSKDSRIEYGMEKTPKMCMIEPIPELTLMIF